MEFRESRKSLGGSPPASPIAANRYKCGLECVFRQPVFSFEACCVEQFGTVRYLVFLVNLVVAIPGTVAVFDSRHHVGGSLSNLGFILNTPHWTRTMQ